MDQENLQHWRLWEQSPLFPPSSPLSPTIPLSLSLSFSPSNVFHPSRSAKGWTGQCIFTTESASSSNPFNVPSKRLWRFRNYSLRSVSARRDDVVTRKSSEYWFSQLIAVWCVRNYPLLNCVNHFQWSIYLQFQLCVVSNL